MAETESEAREAVPPPSLLPGPNPETERLRYRLCLEQSVGSPVGADSLTVVLGSLDIAVSQFDRDWRYTQVNARAAELAQSRPEQLRGRILWELFPCLVGTPFHTHLLQAVADGLPRSFEQAVPAEERYLEHKVFPGAAGVILVTVEVTERRRTEEANRRLVALIEASEDAIYSWGLDGIINNWNPGAEKLYGFTAEEAIGHSVNLIVPADREDEALGIFDRVRNGKSVQQFETVRQRKDGKLVLVSLSAAPVRGEGGAVVALAVVARDITQRKALEERMLQGQKMEAVGRLAGGVAHEFNNLLTVINGYSELMLSGMSANHPDSLFLGEIRKAGNRAAELTHQLLAFSRKQLLAPVVLNLNGLIKDVEKMLRRLIGEHLTMSCELDAALRAIKADPGQIQQVIMNLAINARDAMTTGGVLTLRTDNVVLHNRLVVPHFEAPPGEYVRLTVSDTGHGMDEQTCARIFEPFFTTKEQGQGTGLGLATVFGIVKQSGGLIRVVSAVQRGTSFEVYLPVTDEVPEAARSGGQRSPRRGSETILLVEDEDNVRDLAKHALESHGYRVLTAANGALALELVHATHPDLHLLVTDVVMPRLNGRQLAERLLRPYPELKVLFLSGYTGDALLHHGFGEEVGYMLPKPFTPVTLAARVREILDGRAASS